MTYIPRIFDGILEGYLEGLSAVAIVGAKGVGKTSTARRFARTTLELDMDESARALVCDRQALASLSERPVLIDEWSREPLSWDVVRRIVDDDSSPGRFILTGSASQRGLNIHSGAGRIVKIHMRPMSIEERRISEPSVRLSDLLNGDVDEYLYGESKLTLKDYAHEICASGFPGIRPLSDRAIQAQLDGYIENVVHKEFIELGLRVRRPHILLGWLRAYAEATGSTASYNTILRASTPGEDKKPDKGTTLVYRDLLDALYLTDRVDPWLPTENRFSALGRTPKHYLVDPALAARLLRVNSSDLLFNGSVRMLGPQRASSLLGRLFESMVASTLKVYCQRNEAELAHLRTPDGLHEVDFIVEKGDVIIGIEVKAGSRVLDEDTRQLHWLETRLSPRKTYLKLLVNTDSHTYRRTDGVYVVPLAALGA